MKKLMQINTTPKGDGSNDESTIKVLDYQRFRKTYKRVGLFAVIMGSVLGTGTTVIISLFPDIKIFPVAILLTSITLGIVTAADVYDMSRRLFFGGVPWPPTSEMISPNNYGKVARSYFWKFLKSLGISFGLSLTVWVIYRIAT